MRTLFQRLNANLTRAVIISVVLGFTMSIGMEARSGESAVATHISCADPKVPILILHMEFPDDSAVFKNALRAGVCEYTDESLPVMPVFFLQKVKATSTSAEPYGYIWAIRLINRKVSYWFFWKDAHEAMLKRMYSI